VRLLLNPVKSSAIHHLLQTLAHLIQEEQEASAGEASGFLFRVSLLSDLRVQHIPIFETESLLIPSRCKL
jgi:hypothetical protein